MAYEYLKPNRPDLSENIQSWGHHAPPRVEAAVPLPDGGTVTVYGGAMGWTPALILVHWQDDEGNYHSAWLPKDNVRRVAAAEWDLIHDHHEQLRAIQWAARLPGF